MSLHQSSSSNSVHSMATRVLKADQFEITGQLGSGSFGAVYQATDKITGQIVAVKKIDMENSDDDIEEVQKEISILAGCNNSRITRYYGSFVNGFKLWIIMEYLGGGSCLDLINAKGPLNETAIAQICYDLLYGLQYLHNNGKIHRDIKAANLLVSESGDVKIADFGVAAQLSSNLSIRNTFVGTPFWMAPEVIGQKDYTYSADIWSLGITAIELASSKPPLNHLHPMEVLFHIPRNPPPRLNEKYSAHFQDFVKLCLQKKPQERATVLALLRHPFLKNRSKRELVSRVHEWKRSEESRSKSLAQPMAATIDESSLMLSDEEDSWVFDTIKPRPSPAPLATATESEADASVDEDNFDPRPPIKQVSEPRLERKLSRAGSNLSLLKPQRSSASTSTFSDISSVSEISRVPSPVTYQNFDLTPHNPFANDSTNTTFYDFSDESHIYDTQSRESSTASDRRTHLVKVFSQAANKFNDKTLAEIADILTMEPIPSQVENYLIKKISSSGSYQQRSEHATVKERHYDSLESMFLTTWLNETSKRIN